MRYVEKYRPSALSEIACQQAAVAEIEALLKDNIGGRSLLLTGPPGQGKTSLARVIAKRLGVADSWNLLTIEAGHCDAETVDGMADWLSTLPWSSDGAGFKMAIVDEAQQITEAAEKRLRSVVENLPNYAVLIFTSNPPDGTRTDWFAPATALGSRVERIEFTTPDPIELCRYLMGIARRETGNGNGLPFQEIVARSRGNIREAIKQLETEVRKQAAGTTQASQKFAAQEAAA